MKKIILSLLLVSSLAFAQDNEKENLKKTEEAAAKVFPAISSII